MIQKAEKYQAVCDGCGKKTKLYSSMHSLNMRTNIWAWWEINGKLYCPDCVEYDEETDSYKPKKAEQ